MILKKVKVNVHTKSGVQRIEKNKTDFVSSINEAESITELKKIMLEIVKELGLDNS